MASLRQEMLDACTSGDVRALRRLFEANGVRKGSEPVYSITPSEQPQTSHMIEAAINGGSPDIVMLILKTYGKITIQGNVMTALLNHPNLKILEALCHYDERLINFEWDSEGTRTFLTEACQRPPDTMAPLIRFLVNNGVDLDVGGVLKEFPIHYAVVGGQPLDIIELMIKKGAYVTFAAALQTMRRERIDALELFMKHGFKPDPTWDEALRKEADETGNTELIKLLEKWMQSREEATSKTGTPRKISKIFSGILRRCFGGWGRKGKN